MQMRLYINLGVAVVATALVAVLTLTSTAQAREFAVTSGNIVQKGTNKGIQFPIFPPQGPAAGAIVTATGSNPATLTLPTGVFNSPGVPFGFALTVFPYVQMWTTAGLVAPAYSGAQFKAGLSTARPNANFDFCPGATANPGCTTPAIVPGQGIRSGIVQYDAGANVFSGTMNLLLNGSAAVSVQIGPSRFRHVPMAVPIVNGKPYAFQTFQTGAASDVTLGGVISSMGLINPKGVVTTTYQGTAVTQTGFPFTTGMVRVYVPPKATGEPPTQFTVTGSDNRTPLGAGNITLVAGSIGETFSNGPFGGVAVVNMKLTQIGTVPSTERIGLTVLLAVITASTFVFLRRRHTAA